MPTLAERWCRRRLPMALAAIVLGWSPAVWSPGGSAGDAVRSPAVRSSGVPAVSAAGAVPAQAAAACDGAEGVTVVVDATAVGGGLAVRCALGPQRNGLAALAAAGFSVEGVATSATFVCRIDGRPDGESETCAAIPPPTAYWGYWVVDAGGAWQYASVGGATREPTSGSVEGWAFTSGSEGPVPPGISPAMLAAPPGDGSTGAIAEPGDRFPWPAVAAVVTAVAAVVSALVIAIVMGRRRRAPAGTDRW